MAQYPTTNGSGVVNVLFKRGLENNLFNLKTYEDGCFYLTSDTNRLYVGIVGDSGSVALEAVNEGVTTVENINSLPKLEGAEAVNKTQYQGRFYYCTNDNVLVVCSGNHWVQINPDTNTVLAQNTANTTVTSGGENTNKVVVSNSISDTDGNTSTGSFSIKGGDNVTISNTGTEITIRAKDTTYDLTSYTKKIEGTENEYEKGLKINDSDKVKFTAATNDSNLGKIEVTQANDAIGYQLTLTNQSNTGVNISNGNGTSGNVQGFNVGVSDFNGTVKGSFDPQITVGSAASKKSTQHYENGIAILPVYTTTEVDDLIRDKFKEADAMQYKGTIALTEGKGATTTYSSVTSESNKSNINNGDTYKVIEAGTYGSTALKVGDLLIFNKDGAITFDSVPSGDDQYVTGAVSGNGMTISDGSGTLAQLQLAQGKQIAISPKIDGKTNTVTINHANISTTITQGSASDVTVVTGSEAVSFSAITDISHTNGHITGTTVKQITVKDTHNSITGAAVKFGDTSKNELILNNVINTSDGNVYTPVGGVLSSTSLNIARTDDSTATINLVWGTF